MSNQLLKFVGVSLLSSAIAACGGADKPSSSGSRVSSEGVASFENNFTLSLEGGNTGLCTSLALSNCNNFFTYASSKIYSESLPESSIAIAERPPSYVITQERIDAMEGLIEGATWDAGRLAVMEQVLEYLLENPQDAAGENIYDSITKDQGADNLRDFIANAVFDANGDYAKYNEEPAGFVTAVDVYSDAWGVLEDEEYDAFVAAVIQGEEPAVPTYSVSTEMLTALKASGLFSTAEQAELDTIFSNNEVLALSGVESADFFAAFNSVETGSERLFATTYTAQSVFDDLMIGYPDYPGEPDPLYSYLHLSSSSSYSLVDEELDYMAGEIDTDAAVNSTVRDKTIAVLKEVRKQLGSQLVYGDGEVYADRAAAYAALSDAFTSLEITEHDGATVFAAQETEYPALAGKPDDLYSHLHISSQDRYSLLEEDFDYLKSQSTGDAALVSQTIAVLEAIVATGRTEYIYGAGEEFADRAAAYAQLSTDFQAITVATSNALNTTTGATLFAGFDSLQQDAITAYFLDRPETRLREIAVVNDSVSKEAKGYFNGLVQDAVRMGGEDAKVGIMTINNVNPYESYDAYASIFELAGLEVSWVPVDAASVIAQSDMNDCANLALEVADQSGEAALEVAYADLYAQHLAACQDPSLITAKVNGLDAIFITGGDQVLGMDALVDGADTEWFTDLKARYAAGNLLIAGTSAGAAIAVDGNMFTGGSALEALETSAEVDATAGLGVFPYGIVDTHTDERGRVARIAKALMQTGTDLGFGINEAGSLRVAKVSDTEVTMLVGGNGAFVVDASNATALGKNISNLELHYLSNGDLITLDPTTNTISVTFASTKTSNNDAGFNSEAGPYTSSNDVFSANAISDFVFGTYLDGFDDNPLVLEGPLTDADGADVDPEFTLTITRDADSNVVSNGAGYKSFTGFALDIAEII